MKLVFPIHPRTRNNIKGTDLGKRVEAMENLILLDPVGYLDFLCLTINSALVMTDSGGIQEESTYLGVPCLTLRENTERPITITMGTNVLVGTDPIPLRIEVDRILAGDAKIGIVPPLWEGRAAERIADVLAAWRDQAAA